MKRHTESCSCTNCAYKSRSKRPSVQQLVADGTRIDKLFYGKYLPLRERKLLEKLVRTRTVYDNVKNRLLSTSGSSDQTRSDYTGKSQRYYNKTKRKMVDVSHRREIRSSNTSKLSSCCNCCSCGSLKKIKENIEKHPHVHKHYVPYENITKYKTNAEMRVKARRRRLGSKISGKIKDLRLNSKNIHSDPCFCTLSLLKFSSKRSIKKLMSKEDAKRTVGPPIPFADSELEERNKPGQTLRNLKQSIVNSIESRFKIKKDSLSLFRAKLRKRAMRRRMYDSESYTTEFRPGHRRKKKKSYHRLSGMYVKSVSSSTSKPKLKTSAVKMKSKPKPKKMRKSKRRNILNQESQVSFLGKISSKPSQYQKRKSHTSSSLTTTSIKTSLKSGLQTLSQPKHTIHSSAQVNSSLSLKKNHTENSFRRCFCTLKLQKKIRNLKTSTSKKTMASFSTRYSDKKDFMRNKQTKSFDGENSKMGSFVSFLPTDCEPSVCTQRKCNRQECAKVTNARYRKELKRNRKLTNTKVISRKSTSSLIFEGKTKTRHEKTQSMKRKKKHKYAKGVEVHRPRVNDTMSQVVKSIKTEPTNIEAFWHKCFCSLKIFNKDSSKKKSGTIRPDKKNDGIVKVPNKMTTQNTENIKYLNETPKLLPFQCEPGVCIPDHCDPYECEKLIKQRNIQQKNKYQDTNVNTRSTYSEIPKQTISSKTQHGKVQAREKKINKTNHNPKKPEENIDQAHSNREVVRIGSNFSFNIEFYKERSQVDSSKEIENTSKVKRKQMREKLRNKPEYTKPRQVNIKSRGSQSTMDSKHIAVSAEPKAKLRNVYVGSPRKSKCLCTFKLHKKGRNAKANENIFLTSKSTKTTLQLFGPEQANTSVIKSTNTSEILKHQFKSYECTPGFCVPNKCDPYKCYDEIKKRDIKRYRSRNVATGREVRSVVSMTSSEFSSSNKSRSSKSSGISKPQQDHLVKTRQDKFETNYLPSRQAVRIGSNFSFSIDLYKDYYNPNTRGKIIPIMYNTVDNLTYISKMKHKSTKHRQYISKNHLLHASDIVKTNDKTSTVGNTLKRCFCSLMLQSKEYGRNDNNPDFHSVGPGIAHFAEVMPRQELKGMISKIKSFNPLCITTRKLSKNISEYGTDSNKLNLNLSTVNFKSQNGIQTYDFNRSSHSIYNEFGKYDENTKKSMTKWQQYTEFAVKSVVNIPSQRNKNPFYKSYYALNLKVSQIHKTPQVLEDDECEPDFCVPYQCDTVECLKRIKSRFKSWKDTETDTPDTRATASMTDRKRFSHNYAQADKHSVLKVFHPTKRKQRYGSNIKLNMSVYTHSDDSSKEPAKRTPIHPFDNAYTNKYKDENKRDYEKLTATRLRRSYDKKKPYRGSNQYDYPQSQYNHQQKEDTNTFKQKPSRISSFKKYASNKFQSQDKQDDTNHQLMNTQTESALYSKSSRRHRKTEDIQTEPAVSKSTYIGKERRSMNIETEPVALAKLFRSGKGGSVKSAMESEIKAQDIQSGKSRKSVHIAEPEVLPKVIYSGKYNRTMHKPTDSNELPKSIYRGKYNARLEPEVLSKASKSRKYSKLRSIRTDRASRLARSRRSTMPEELEKFLMKPPRRKVYTIGSSINLSMQFYKEDDTLAVDANQQAGHADASSGIFKKIRCFCTSKKRDTLDTKTSDLTSDQSSVLSKSTKTKGDGASKGTEDISKKSGLTKSEVSSVEEGSEYEGSKQTKQSAVSKLFKKSAYEVSSMKSDSKKSHSKKSEECLDECLVKSEKSKSKLSKTSRKSKISKDSDQICTEISESKKKMIRIIDSSMPEVPEKNEVSEKIEVPENAEKNKEETASKKPEIKPTCTCKMPDCTCTYEKPICDCKMPVCKCKMPVCKCEMPICKCEMPICKCKMPICKCKMPICKCKMPVCKCKMPKCKCKKKAKRQEKKKEDKGNDELCDCNQSKKHRRLRSKSTKVCQNSLSVKSDVLSYDKSTLTTGSRFSKSLYECEPHVCIPGVCDPNVCYKIFKSKRRLKDISVSATKEVKSKLIGTITSLPMASSAAKRCFCIFKLKNRQAQSMVEKSLSGELREKKDIQRTETGSFFRKSVGKVGSLFKKSEIPRKKTPIQFETEEVHIPKQATAMEINKPHTERISEKGPEQYTFDDSERPQVVPRKKKRHHSCKCQKNIKEPHRKKTCECVQQYLDSSKYPQPPDMQQYEEFEATSPVVAKSIKSKKITSGLQDSVQIKNIDLESSVRSKYSKQQDMDLDISKQGKRISKKTKPELAISQPKVNIQQKSEIEHTKLNPVNIEKRFLCDPKKCKHYPYCKCLLRELQERADFQALQHKTVSMAIPRKQTTVMEIPPKQATAMEINIPHTVRFSQKGPEQYAFDDSKLPQVLPRKRKRRNICKCQDNIKEPHKKKVCECVQQYLDKSKYPHPELPDVKHYEVMQQGMDLEISNQNKRSSKNTKKELPMPQSKVILKQQSEIEHTKLNPLNIKRRRLCDPKKCKNYPYCKCLLRELQEMADFAAQGQETVSGTSDESKRLLQRIKAVPPRLSHSLKSKLTNSIKNIFKPDKTLQKTDKEEIMPTLFSELEPDILNVSLSKGEGLKSVKDQKYTICKCPTCQCFVEKMDLREEKPSETDTKRKQRHFKNIPLRISKSIKSKSLILSIKKREKRGKVEKGKIKRKKVKKDEMKRDEIEKDFKPKKPKSAYVKKRKSYKIEQSRSSESFTPGSSGLSGQSISKKQYPVCKCNKLLKGMSICTCQPVEELELGSGKIRMIRSRISQLSKLKSFSTKTKLKKRKRIEQDSEVEEKETPKSKKEKKNKPKKGRKEEIEKDFEVEAQESPKSKNKRSEPIKRRKKEMKVEEDSEVKEKESPKLKKTKLKKSKAEKVKRKVMELEEPNLSKLSQKKSKLIESPAKSDSLKSRPILDKQSKIRIPGMVCKCGKKLKPKLKGICECQLQDIVDLGEQTTDSGIENRKSRIIDAVKKISRSLKLKSPSIGLSLTKKPKSSIKKPTKYKTEESKTHKLGGKISIDKDQISAMIKSGIDVGVVETPPTESKTKKNICKCGKEGPKSKSKGICECSTVPEKPPDLAAGDTKPKSIKLADGELVQPGTQNIEQSLSMVPKPELIKLAAGDQMTRISQKIKHGFPKRKKDKTSESVKLAPTTATLAATAAAADGAQKSIHDPLIAVCPCCGKSNFIDMIIKTNVHNKHDDKNNQELSICECQKSHKPSISNKEKTTPPQPIPTIPGLENVCPVCLRSTLTDVCTCGKMTEVAVPSKKGGGAHIPVSPLLKSVCPECSKNLTRVEPTEPSGRQSHSGRASLYTKIKPEQPKPNTPKKKKKKGEPEEPPPPPPPPPPKPIFSMVVDATSMKVKNKEEIYRNLGIGCKDKLHGRYLPPVEDGQEVKPSIDLVIDRDNACILRPDDMIQTFGGGETRKYSMKKKVVEPGMANHAVVCPFCHPNELQKGQVKGAINKPPEGEEHDKHCACCICTDKDGKRKKGHPKNCTCCICRYGCRFGSTPRRTDGPAPGPSHFPQRGQLVKYEESVDKKVVVQEDVPARVSITKGKEKVMKDDKKKEEEEKKKPKKVPVVPVTVKAQKTIKNLQKYTKRFVADNECYCGLSTCGMEIHKADKKAIEILEGDVPPPCICGDLICKKKYTEKTPYYRELEKKREEDHIRKKYRLRRWKKEAFARIREQQLEDTAMRKRIRRQDKNSMKVLEKYLDDTSSWVLLAENASDIGRFGINTIRRMLTSVKRCVRHPLDICYRAQLLRADPKMAAAKALEEFQGSGLSGTSARVRQRCAAMQTSKYLISALEKHPVTNFLYHLRDRDPKKRLLKKKPEKEDLGVECSPFLTSLRQKPCLWLYHLCPWFYPHCLGLLAFWRQFTDVILFLLAVIVWSPCILLTEFCRTVMCCFMCAGGG